MQTTLTTLLLSQAAERQPRLEDLVRRIRAPAGAERLADVATNLQSTFVALADELGSTKIREARDDLVALVTLIALHPDLNNDSDQIVSTKVAPAEYIALMRRPQSWEQEALLHALALTMVAFPASNDAVSDLIDLIDQNLVLPAGIEVPATRTLRIALVAHYLAKRSEYDRRHLQCAKLLDKLVAQVKADGRLFDIGISARNENAIATYLEEVQQRQAPSSSDQLRARLIAITTRAGASLRHAHTPVIRLVARDDAVIPLIGLLEQTAPDIADWIAVHAVMGRFAQPILGGGALPRADYDQATGTLRVSAPSLSATGAPHGPGYEEVTASISLPLPIAIRRLAGRSTNYKEIKRKAAAQLKAFHDRTGAHITFPSLHQMLPVALGRGRIDQTFNCLLGLDESKRNAGIHYLSPAASIIRMRFQEAVTAVAARLSLAEFADGWGVVTSPDAVPFGASPRPSVTDLRCLFQSLARMNARRGRPNCDLFNTLAAEIALRFLAITGARPVGDVVPQAECLSLGDRVTLISEKDSLLYRSTRLAPIDGHLVRLLEKYRSLRANLFPRIDTPLDVFLMNDGQPVPPTVANMRTLVKPVRDQWRWDNDILRHHFYSRLWELGCPSQHIERLVGHLGKSATTDHVHSMAPMFSTLGAATPYVSALIHELSAN